MKKIIILILCCVAMANVCNAAAVDTTHKLKLSQLPILVAIDSGTYVVIAENAGSVWTDYRFKALSFLFKKDSSWYTTPTVLSNAVSSKIPYSDTNAELLTNAAFNSKIATALTGYVLASAIGGGRYSIPYLTGSGGTGASNWVDSPGVGHGYINDTLRLGGLVYLGSTPTAVLADSPLVKGAVKGTVRVVPPPTWVFPATGSWPGNTSGVDTNHTTGVVLWPGMNAQITAQTLDAVAGRNNVTTKDLQVGVNTKTVVDSLGVTVTAGGVAKARLSATSTSSGASGRLDLYNNNGGSTYIDMLLPNPASTGGTNYEPSKHNDTLAVKGDIAGKVNYSDTVSFIASIATLRNSLNNLLNSTNVYTAAQWVYMGSLGTSTTDGLVIADTTAATVGLQHNTPVQRWKMRSYVTTGGVSQPYDVLMYGVPSNASVASGSLNIAHSANNGANVVDVQVGASQIGLFGTTTVSGTYNFQTGGSNIFNGTTALNGTTTVAAGKKLNYTTGGSQPTAYTTALVSGSATFSTTATDASSIMFVGYSPISGATPTYNDILRVVSFTAGSSFTVSAFTPGGTTVNTSDMQNIYVIVAN